MKLKRYFILTMVSCFSLLSFASKGNDGGIAETQEALQQDKTILVRGVVRDSDGNTLPGVTVVLNGHNTGCATDLDGKFSMRIPADIKSPLLIISFVGMSKQQVKVEPGKELVITLRDDAQLQEVVVTGIFNKAKESYTGAAKSMTKKELKIAGSRSMVKAIQNLDPSFSIADNVSIGSDPNKLPTITMRGSSSLPVDVKDMQSSTESMRTANQPLFVLNGFEISLQKFMDLDQNLVENIVLLKDAAATAMYGTKGSNGVVVITTSKPEAGKLRVTYTGHLNLEMKDLSSYKLTNSLEKLQYEKLAGLYNSNQVQNQLFLDELYNKRMTDAQRGVDTYWLKYPTRTGIGSRHTLQIDGGEDTFLYALNLGYNNIEGAMKGSNRNTFNGSMFFQYNVKNLTFMNELEITNTKSKDSKYGNFEDYTILNSYWKPYNDAGGMQKLVESYIDPITGEKKTYNPLFNASLPSKNEQKYTQIRNNFAIEWHILPELFFRGQFAITSQTNRTDRYVSAENSKFDKFVGKDAERKGTYDYGTGEMFKYELMGTLNYTKVFNKVHQVFAGTGITMEDTKFENYEISAEGLTVPNLDFLGLANKYKKDGRPFGSEEKFRNFGVLFNGSYTYDRRYFLDVSGKYEGSSRFGSKNKFAPFWSVGAGWNVTNEKFLTDNPILNTLRLRLSYGSTGSQAFSPYLASMTYSDNGGKGYQGWYGVTLKALGNKDLKWQKTNQINVGADIELCDRIRINVDYYRKKTNNLLADISIPTAAGFDRYKANVGEVENNGIEVGLNAFILKRKPMTKGLDWMVGVNIAHNKNRINKISNSLDAMNKETASNVNINPGFLFKEGESMGTIYAVRSKGIDPSTGKEIFIKRDGTETYKWDSDDLVACGVKDPKINGTFNTTIRYGGFDLAAYFRFRVGAKAYNETLANKVENVNPKYNLDKRALTGRWSKPGDIARFKSMTDFSTTRVTDRFIMKDNSLSCESISLGYEVPSEWSRKNLFVSYLTLRANIEDVFYASSIKRERGLSYPYARKFSFTLTARF